MTLFSRQMRCSYQASWKLLTSSEVERGTHTHTHTHSNTHTLTHTQSHSRSHILTHTLTQTRTQSHTLTHTHTHTVTHSHIRTHTVTHSHTHTHTHTYSHTHTHTHAGGLESLISSPLGREVAILSHSSEVLLAAHGDCQTSVVSAYLGIVSPLRSVVLMLAPAFFVVEKRLSISNVWSRCIHALLPRLQDSLNFVSSWLV